MEKIYFAPEELESRFRSKQNLYGQLTIDRKLEMLYILTSRAVVAIF